MMSQRRNSTFTRRDSGEYVRDDGKDQGFIILVLRTGWLTVSVLYSILIELFVWTFQGFIEIKENRNNRMEERRRSSCTGTTQVQGLLDIDNMSTQMTFNGYSENKKWTGLYLYYSRLFEVSDYI